MTKHQDNLARLAETNIACGDFDIYLKSLYEAITGRKSELGSALPTQEQIPKDELPLNYGTAVVENDAPVSVAAPVSRSPRPYRRQKLTPPDPNTVQEFTGHFVAVHDSDHKATNTVTINSKTYVKSDFLGKVIDISKWLYVPSISVRAQIIGVGPKAVKMILVDSVPSGTIHQEGRRKIDLFNAWKNVEPFYTSHEVLEPFLRGEWA